MTRPIPIALIKILIEVIMLLACFSAMHINAIGQNRPSSFPDKKQLFIGPWKFDGLSIQCLELPEIIQDLNTPSTQLSLRSQFGTMTYDFQTDGTLIINDVMKKKYTVFEDSLILETMQVERNFENYSDSLYATGQAFTSDTTYTYERFMIKQINSNVLEITETVQIKDYSFSPIHFFLSNKLKDLNGKFIQVTTKFKKTKIPEAPWTKLSVFPSRDSSDLELINNKGIVTMGRAKNLICINDKTLCFLRPAKEFTSEQDTLYYSRDYGNTWNQRAAELNKKVYRNWIGGESYQNYQILKDRIIRIYTSGNHLILKTLITEYYTEDLSQALIPKNKLSKNELNHIHQYDDILSKKVMAKWLFRPNIDEENIRPKSTFEYSDSLIIYTNINSSNQFKCAVYYSKINERGWHESTWDTASFPMFYPIATKIFDSAAYIWTINGLFISTDDGQSWVPKTTSDITLSTNSEHLYDPKDISGTFLKHSNYWLAGCDTGVWVSKDGGITWLNLNNKELNAGVNSLAVQGDEVFAMSNQGFVWKANLDELLLYAEED